MRSPLPPRDPQRGNSLLLALIVMSALATLGSLTVVSMQSSIQLSTNDRAQAIALYAAESGAAVAMDFLRRNFDPSGAFSAFASSWSTYCTANNSLPLVDMHQYIPSSDALPGDPGHNNLFDGDQNAWFHIDILNNRDDQGFTTNTSTCDTDGILIIRSTGHGPQSSVAILEWTVQRVGFWGSIRGNPQVALPSFPIPSNQPLVAYPGPLGPPVAPRYWLYPPWTDIHADPPATSFATSPSWGSPWDWVPISADIHGVGPASFANVGMVLRGWHIVSL
jgi:hypothetical protein